MMQLLLSEKVVAIYEIVVIFILILMLIRQSKRNKAIKERRQINNKRKRNEMLDELLKNPDIQSEWSGQPKPFDVQYAHTVNVNHDAIPGFQVEIEVHTETSVQRYLFDLDQQVTIGRDEKNVLPLTDKLIAKRSCTIFVKNKAVYVKNDTSENPICIQRGKNRQCIQNQMVKLQSKDILTMGKTTLHISLYEN